MEFPINWSDEGAVARAFRYATRVGIGVHFGSRPIGWYQQHQCAALDELERCARVATGARHRVAVRVRAGKFWARELPDGREVLCGTPSEIFTVANKKAKDQ